MSLGTWIRGLIGGPSMTRYEEAEKRTEEVAETARELFRKLEPYQSEKDPFQALMIDLYNRRAEMINNSKMSSR